MKETNKENEILKDTEIRVLKKIGNEINTIKEELIENNILNKNIFEEIENTNKLLTEFNILKSDINKMIDFRYIILQKKIFLQSISLNKESIKVYVGKIETSNWLDTKLKGNEDGKNKLKTDTFVGEMVKTKMYSIKMYYAFLLDLSKNIENTIDSINTMSFYLKDKINYLIEEKKDTNSY